MRAPQQRRPRTTLALALGLGLAHLAGCDQPTGSTRPRARVPAPPAADQAPAVAANPEARPRAILNERTQDIRDAAKEAKAGGVEADGKILAKDPITLPGNAYVSIIGQTAKLNIEHALDLYKAETGEFPKTTEEFMEKIIKANNMALPKLPFYQEYGYKADEHRLIIIEYPARKAEAGYPR